MNLAKAQSKARKRAAQEVILQSDRVLSSTKKPPGCEAWRLFWDCVCLHRRLTERTELRANQRRHRDAVDLPNLSGEVDDICGMPDELE